jgi:hypothetical protein
MKDEESSVKLAKWLANRAIDSRQPDLMIGGKDDPYLLRWYVIPRNRFLNVYAHIFMRSDDDRALHDHPWWNASILVEGEYTEHTIDAGGINRRIVRKAGDWKLRGARAAHRIELHAGPCRTLFITGPRLREWGFHCPEAGWRHWKIFTAGPRGETVDRGCE